MENEKRMIQNFEITQCVQIGSKEVVIGINENATDGMKYMCCFVERNELFELYNSVMVSDDYAQVIALYGERLKDAALEFIEQNKDISNQVLTENDCITDHYSRNIQGKVIVRNVKHLRPEYQRAEYQLYFVTGGFGSYGNARGSAVYCTNLHSGKDVRIERMEVVGEIKPECLPEWAKETADRLKKDYKRKHKEVER